MRPRRKREAEHFAGGFGVVIKHLIKIPHAKKQDRVFMLRLDRQILPHQRRRQVVLVNGNVLVGGFQDLTLGHELVDEI